LPYHQVFPEQATGRVGKTHGSDVANWLAIVLRGRIALACRSKWRPVEHNVVQQLAQRRKLLTPVAVSALNSMQSGWARQDRFSCKRMANSRCRRAVHTRCGRPRLELRVRCRSRKSALGCTGWCKQLGIEIPEAAESISGSQGPIATRMAGDWWNSGFAATQLDTRPFRLRS
jgi:hypothetical protein